MPSNEYLQQVTTGEVEELNGEIVRCEYDDLAQNTWKYVQNYADAKS